MARVVGTRGVAPESDADSSRGHRFRFVPRSARGRDIALVCTVGVGAAILRLVAVTTAYDIFIDEVSYTQLAHNLAHGHGLFLNGEPFMLHPPTAFVLFSLVVRAFHMQGPTDALLFQLRPFVALMGALICVIAYVLVRLAAKHRRPAILTAALLAIDPFVIRFDSRVMLETPAQLAAVTTFACIAGLLRARSERARRWLIASAGVAGALTMATKETFGLVLLITLSILMCTGWVLDRRTAVTVSAISIAGYGLIVGVFGMPGGVHRWVSTKMYGLSRLIGTRQETGFNAASTHVSLVSRVIADVSQFAATYVLLVLGGFAVLALLWQRKPWRDDWRSARPRERTVLLIAVWGFSASAYLGYAIAFGSIEEQMFYILAIPLFASLFLWSEGAVPSLRFQWRVAAIALLSVALIFDGAVWAVVHSKPDDEYRKFLAWERVEIPEGSVVAVTEYTAQFLLHGVVIGQWASLDAIRAHRVDYVVMVTALTTQGYGLATPTFQSELEHGARLVFQAKGRAEGSFRVYDVRSLTGGSGT
jgi:hypothetical protein